MIRAFRPINLLVIVLVCLAFQVLSLALRETSLGLLTNNIIFYIIVAVLIGTTGYLINGHYDRNIDAVNHKGYQFPFSKSQVYGLCLFLAGISLVIGFSVFSFKFTLSFLVLPIVTLWLYSAFFKKLPLIGNLSIAFVALLLPIGLLFLNNNLPDLRENTFFAHLALTLLSEIFLITLGRELVKDIQDIEGDKAENCKTLPILFGEKAAGIVASSVLLVASLIWFNMISKQMENLSIASTLLSIATLLLLISSFFLLWSSKPWTEKTKLSSLMLKVGMFTALLTVFFI